MPSAWAWVFIISANTASLPARYSATATVASLPDEMTMPRSRSEMLTSLPGSIHISDEPANTGFWDQAFSLTTTMSSAFTRPASISLAST